MVQDCLICGESVKQRKWKSHQFSHKKTRHHKILLQGYQACSIDEVAGMSTIIASSQSETGSVLQLSDNPEVTTTEIMDDVFDCIDDYMPDVNEEEQCEVESKEVKEDDQQEETIMDDVFDCIDDYMPDVNEEEQCEEESQEVKEDDQEEETDLLPDNQENDTILFLLQHKEATQSALSVKSLDNATSSLSEQEKASLEFKKLLQDNNVTKNATEIIFKWLKDYHQKKGYGTTYLIHLIHSSRIFAYFMLHR
jgi:hypothetical protein